jgi:transcriptional regulator with XRE-family HTH domain
MTADTRELYVSALFAELDFLGVSQREVATYFGVTEGIVSRWARGKTPMSMRRADAFLAFVKEAEQRAIEQAKSQPTQPEGKTLPTRGLPSTPEEELRQKLLEYWGRWHDEIEETNLEIYQDLANQLQALRRYIGMDKEKLREALNAAPDARRTRTAITIAGKGVVREMNRLERIRPLEVGPDDAA